MNAIYAGIIREGIKLARENFPEDLVWERCNQLGRDAYTRERINMRRRWKERAVAMVMKARQDKLEQLKAKLVTQRVDMQFNHIITQNFGGMG